MSTGREAIILYCISTFIHKCLHKWVCVRVALTCDVILAWRVLQSNVAHSQRAARLETHLTERFAAWTGGDMVSQTNHVNPLLVQPTCMRLYRSTWRRMHCTTKPYCSHDIREASLSPFSKLNRIWRERLSVCPGSDYCGFLCSHLIQMTLFGPQIIQIVASSPMPTRNNCCFSLHMLSDHFKSKTVDLFLFCFWSCHWKLVM